MTTPSHTARSFVGVIPARQGSKGVPRKNLALLCGRPLLSYMIEAALASDRLTDLVVSSDDHEILEVAREYGGARLRPLLRPAELAQDSTPSLPVIKHAVELLEAERGRPYDYVAMFQCTTPLVSAGDIAGALDLLADSGADAVMSVFETNESHPAKAKRLSADGRLTQYLPDVPETQFTRQKLETVYRRNGAVYASRRDVVMQTGKLYGGDDLVTRGYVMPPERSVDINHPLDLVIAAAIINQTAAG